MSAITPGSGATDEDVLEFRKHDDGIARSSWDIDVWPAESYDAPAVPREDPEYEKRIERLRQGEYFDIRYGCLVAKGIDNLLMAGRCISGDFLAHSSYRVTGNSVAMGEAAGAGAAIAARTKRRPQDVPWPEIRAALDRADNPEPTNP
jgi:hypothetical protein